LYKETKLDYGSASLEGYMGVDTACLSDYAGTSSCADNFNFFIITKESGLSNDGILGFGPPHPQNGPSFV